MSKNLKKTKKNKKRKIMHYTARTKEGCERERHADYGFFAK